MQKIVIEVGFARGKTTRFNERKKFMQEQNSVPTEENSLVKAVKQSLRPLTLEEIFPKPDPKDPFAAPLIHPSQKLKRRNRNKVQKASRKANRYA